jgi:hypothetical protein
LIAVYDPAKHQAPPTMRIYCSSHIRSNFTSTGLGTANQLQRIQEPKFFVRLKRSFRPPSPIAADAFVDGPATFVAQAPNSAVQRVERMPGSEGALLSSCERLCRPDAEERVEPAGRRVDFVSGSPPFAVELEDPSTLKPDHVWEPATSRMSHHPVAEFPPLLLDHAWHSRPRTQVSSYRPNADHCRAHNVPGPVGKPSLAELTVGQINDDPIIQASSEVRR